MPTAPPNSLSEGKLTPLRNTAKMIRFHSPHSIIKDRYRAASLFIAALLTFSLLAQSQAKEKPMTQATGTFEVKLTPQSDGKPEDSPIGRMTIDKQIHGDLEATSKGQMLAFSTDVKGSAGYVAMERVTGTLHGRTGSFVLQHSATMNRGVPHLSITVVPDSGTDQLTGLTGTFDIQIAEGKHSYTFDYTLPETP
jgi:hypothetical protein